MKIKYIEGICQNCKNSVEIAIDINSDKIYTKNNLESFNEYKNTGLSVCPMCGFIAPNITQDDNSYLSQSDNVNSSFYYNYEYLPSLKLIETDLFKTYAPNNYECYAKCLIGMGDIDNGIRFMYRAIEIKKSIAQILSRQKFEDFDDDELEKRNNIDLVIDELNDSIFENQKEILNVYNIGNNVFTLIMFVLTLKELNLDKEANEFFEKIKKLDVEPDLLNYLSSKLN